MKVKVFSVYDTVASRYFPPLFRLEHGEALRDFKDMANDPGLVISKHASDFKLYYLGEWDDSTGRFTCADVALDLGCAKTFQDVPPRPVGMTASDPGMMALPNGKVE